MQKLWHQLFSKTVFWGVVTGPEPPSRPAKFPCITVPASPEDMKECFDNIKLESKDGKYQLLVRKWYHERGFGTPYVTKTLDTKEICQVSWMITSGDLEQSNLRNLFPELKENEVMFENIYTIERFRRLGVQASTAHQIHAIRMSKGMLWTKGYVATDNIPELRFGQQRGSQIFEKVSERHFLFHVTRKTLATFDPPLAIAELLDSE